MTPRPSAIPTPPNRPADVVPSVLDFMPTHYTPRARWRPRKGIGRIRRDEVKARGWHRDPSWVGRPGKGLTPFAADDPRVEPEDCAHGQIKDLDNGPGPVSRCLDCGGLIRTAARTLLDAPDVLDDEALDAHRQAWNSAHWDPPTF